MSRWVDFIMKGITRLDPQAWTLLIPHSDKNICIHIHEKKPLYLHIQPDGLFIIPYPPPLIHTTFSGSLSAFVQAMRIKGTHSNLTISGDLECAKALQATLAHLDLDWEGQLATVVGGEVAYMMSQGFKYSAQWFKKTYTARTDDLVAYLQDEVQYLPLSWEIENYYEAIDALRDDVERLEAKIHHLMRKAACD